MACKVRIPAFRRSEMTWAGRQSDSGIAHLDFSTWRRRDADGRRLARHLPPPAQRVVDLGGEIAAGVPAQLRLGFGDVADKLR
jgi:hypothetical protein